MSYAVITDSTGNLPAALARKLKINIIPFPYFVGTEPATCPDPDNFDDEGYYASLRKGVRVTTSQINPTTYREAMEPHFAAGRDVFFVGLSSGISGSYASACAAAAELCGEYPGRRAVCIDSRGAGLGQGMLALRAAMLRNAGEDLSAAEAEVSRMRDRMYQVFTVDDLGHLARTGRLSNMGARLGTMLHIKPILKGSSEGKIVAFEKIRGRREAIRRLAEKYATLVRERLLVGISYAGCREEAEWLAELLCKEKAPEELLLVRHEPVTGSHLGPGALALFFVGGDGVREL